MKTCFKKFLSRIDFNKVKNCLIVIFCIFSAVMNIINICGSKKDSIIYFTDPLPSVSADALSDADADVPDTVPAEKTDTKAETQEKSFKININTAGKSELMELKGIGEAKASAIIDYRNEFGSFVSIEEIKLVRGIGDKIFSNIKDEICIE